MLSLAVLAHGVASGGMLWHSYDLGAARHVGQWNWALDHGCEPQPSTDTLRCLVWVSMDHIAVEKDLP